MKAAALADRVLYEQAGYAHLNTFTYKFEEYKETGTYKALYNSGAGDTLDILFHCDAIIIKGFSHEAYTSPFAQENFQVYEGGYNSTPPDLLELLNLHTDHPDHVTFCIWREHNQGPFLKGIVDYPSDETDGTEWMIEQIITSQHQFIKLAAAFDLQGDVDEFNHRVARIFETPLA